MVSFANPKRIRPGEPPEPAIAPRKLFVGQVSNLIVYNDAFCMLMTAHQ